MSCSDLDTTSSCIFCGAKVTCHLRSQSSRRRSVVLRRAVTACSSPGPTALFSSRGVKAALTSPSFVVIAVSPATTGREGGSLVG
ncbi:hypothetical protein E2C01_030746 [Portunus trituberculatus]|uniref:Uncharacterized protein n=1 Tax=Portunus trituberculatus TaxID=210409 RepID=A0A5B7EWN1_PORTR|nr:hypothetical protein [Portunus trituberculatus]